MRWVWAAAAMALLVACGGSSGSGGPTGAQTGSVELKALCPQLHLAIDALVVSVPAAQRAFVVEVQRISDAGTPASRTAIAPLLAASRTLETAGTGPDYFTAMSGIHPAVVSVDGECVRAGSPILHGGH